MAENKFLGFEVVKKASFLALGQEEKLNKLWFVRDYNEDGSVKTAEIYFGSRKYGEINVAAEAELEAVNEKVASIVEALGGSVDENGEFVGFLPMEGHDILGDEGIENVSDALAALEEAILANKAALEDKADASEVKELEARVAAAESGLTEAQAAISTLEDNLAEAGKVDDVLVDGESVLGDDKIARIDLTPYAKDAEVKAAVSAVTEDIAALDSKIAALESASTDSLVALEEEVAKKADADDVYTKEEIDGKISGVWHFKGVVDSLDDVVKPANGDVYQVEDKEFAWNGSEWVELGFNVDLSNYATKDDVDDVKAMVAEHTSAVTEALEVLEGEVATVDGKVEDVKKEVEALQGVATTTAQTFADAEELELELGQIVYVKETTISEENSGDTRYAGAYINTEAGLVKLEASKVGEDTPEERLQALESEVAALKADTTHIIGGDDIEELIEA